MKKITCSLLLVFCCWVALSGFSYVEGGAILYQSGRVNEVVAIGVSSEDAQTLGTDLNTLNSDVAQAFALTKIHVESLYSLHIRTDASITPEQKTAYLESISVSVDSDRLIVSFANYETWSYMCQNVKDNITEETEKNLFTTVYKQKSIMKLSGVKNGETTVNLYEIVYSKVTSLLTSKYPGFNQIASTDLSYTYVTTKARLHSDANTISKSLQDGMIYHTWNFEDFSDLSEISFWQVTANTYVWYILALLLTAGFAVVLVVVSKHKKPQKPQNPDVIEIQP